MNGYPDPEWNHIHYLLFLSEPKEINYVETLKGIGSSGSTDVR